MVFDRSMNFSSSSPKGSAPPSRYFQTHAALCGGADVALLSRSPLLTLIHRYGRNIFRRWRNTHNPAARNRPFHLRQVPEEAGDASGQVWSIAHQQAELQAGRGGGGGERRHRQQSVSRQSSAFPVPPVSPFNTDPLKLPLCPPAAASRPPPRRRNKKAKDGGSFPTQRRLAEPLGTAVQRRWPWQFFVPLVALQKHCHPQCPRQEPVAAAAAARCLPAWEQQRVPQRPSATPQLQQPARDGQPCPHRPHHERGPSPRQSGA